MNKKLKLELGIITAIIIAALIFNPLYNNKITGTATFGQLEQQAIEKSTKELAAMRTVYPAINYSAPLAFSVPIEYDFNDYNSIAGVIDSIVNDYKGEPIKEYIKKKSSLTGFDVLIKLNSELIVGQDWSKCQDIDDSFVSDFEEFYDNCKNSANDNCYCVLKTGKMPSDSAFETIGKESGLPQGIPVEVLKTFMSKPEIVLYKNNSNVSFAEKAVNLCGMQQRTFKACFINNTKKITDVYSKPLAGKTVPILFAFMMKELAPPPLEFVAVLDKLKAENSLLLSWPKSPVEVSEYHAYISSSDFSSLNITEIRDKVNKGEIQQLNISPNNPLNFGKLDYSAVPECKFANGKCEYRYPFNIPIILVNNALLFDNTTYYYAFHSADDKQVFIGMTAVGKKGLELDNIKDKMPIEKAASVDDLAPGMVGNLKLASKNLTDAKFTFTKHASNIDGSQISESEQIRYFLYWKDCNIPKYSETDNTLSYDTTITVPLSALPKDNICISAIAVDEKDNPKFDSKEAEELLKAVEIKI